MAVSCLKVTCASCGREDEYTGTLYGDIQRKITEDGWRTRYITQLKKHVDICPSVDCQNKACYNSK